MKNILVAFTLFISFYTLTTAAQEQSSKISFISTPMDTYWFLKAGGRYLVKCADSEMKIIQKKYPTLQCRYQVSLDSSRVLSLYSINIPEDFSDLLLEQLKKENIYIQHPYKLRAP